MKTMRQRREEKREVQLEEARSRLVFPPLTPRFAPAAPWTFVNYPTALWLDGDTATPRLSQAV